MATATIGLKYTIGALFRRSSTRIDEVVSEFSVAMPLLSAATRTWQGGEGQMDDGVG